MGADPGTEVTGTLEFMDPYTGLRSLLNEMSGEVVALHLISGGEVRGKLVSKDGHEDGIATVRRRTLHHVPLHMIVCVEEVQE